MAGATREHQRGGSAVRMAARPLALVVGCEDDRRLDVLETFPRPSLRYVAKMRVNGRNKDCLKNGFGLRVPMRSGSIGEISGKRRRAVISDSSRPNATNPFNALEGR